jgi:hypothetical protein
MATAQLISTRVFTNDVVTSLITNNGGTVTESTSGHPELNDMSSLYWKFHSPLGVPGDLILVPEPYKIDKVCQERTGFTVNITYQYDGSAFSFESAYAVPLTAEGVWLSNQSPTDIRAIRLKLLIQEINVINQDWVFTVARI